MGKQTEGCVNIFYTGDTRLPLQEAWRFIGITELLQYVRHVCWCDTSLLETQDNEIGGVQ